MDKGNTIHRENDSEDIIDIKRYLIIIYQHRWTLLLFILFFTGLALTYSLFKAPVYQGSFSIYYKQIVNNADPNKSKAEEPDAELWLKVMNTPKMLELIQKNASIRLNAHSTSQIFTVSKEKKNNYLYNIKVKCGNATDIPILARSYVESLNQIERENNSERLSSLLKYLRQQLSENKTKLRQTNVEISQLSKLLNIDEITDRDQLKSVYHNYQKSIKDLRIKLSTILAEKHETQKEFTHLKDTLFYETSFSEPLKVQLMNLKIDLARSLTKYKSAHPHILRIKENIRKVETLLKKGVDQNIEIKNLSANPIKRELYARMAKLNIDEQSILAEIKATKDIIGKFNTQMNINSEDKGIQYLLTQREQLMAAIELLNKKITETDTFLRGSTNNFITVTPARIPSGKSNKALAFFLAIGIFGGCVMGIGFIILLDLIDNRLKIISDVENYYNLNILGSFIHRKKNHDIKQVSELKSHQINEKYYRELTEMRINLDQLMPESNKNLISIVSPHRREGKTITAYLLAHEYARSNKKVLLIDLDTYLPRLSMSLGMKDKKGLQDFLLADEKLEDCIHPVILGSLDIMACGQNKYENQIFYDNKKFEELLYKVSGEYDKVILDTPGLLFFPEIVSLLKKIHHVIIISRMRRTTRYKLDKLVKKIHSLPINILGTIVTDLVASPFSAEYSYYRNSYYSQKEKNSFYGVKPRNRKLRYAAYSGVVIISVFLSIFIYHNTLRQESEMTEAETKEILLQTKARPQQEETKQRQKTVKTIQKTKVESKAGQKVNIPKRAKAITEVEQRVKTETKVARNTSTKDTRKQNPEVSPKPAARLVHKAIHTAAPELKAQAGSKQKLKSRAVHKPVARSAPEIMPKESHNKCLLVANCFSSKANAEKNCKLLKSQGYYGAFVYRDSKNYKVILKAFPNHEEAKKYSLKHKKEISTWVYTIK